MTQHKVAACAAGSNADGVLGKFPFVDGFEALLDGVVSFKYVQSVGDMLVPTIDVLAEVVAQPGGSRSSVWRALLYAVAAKARVQVAVAYEPELVGAEEMSRSDLLAALDREWSNLKMREGMLLVEYDSEIASFICPQLRDLWRVQASFGLCMLEQVRAAYGEALDEVRFVSVGAVLIENDKGVLASELRGRDVEKVVVPAQTYERLLALVPVGACTATSLSPATLMEHQLLPENLGFGEVSVPVLQEWLWLLLSARGATEGYCYQAVFAPAYRFGACRFLGANPLVTELSWHLSKAHCRWSGYDAECVRDGDLMHVSSPGNFDVVSAAGLTGVRIGGAHSREEDPGSEDLYAKALVDRFLKKHTKTIPAPVQPVSVGFDQMPSRARRSSSVVSRGFVNVADELYAGIDQLLSPRAGTAEAPHSHAAVPEAPMTEVDGERLRDLYARLADGAYVDEEYYTRMKRRFRHRLHRPRLDPNDGRMYHVFAGFPADCETGSGLWQVDDTWSVPGWDSYVAYLRASEVATLSFVSSSPCSDIRMDCTGTGSVDLGACAFSMDRAVLWFSQSVKFRVYAATAAVLRVCVPRAGMARAMTADLRRYMRIPGYAVVARNFGVVSRSGGEIVEVNRVAKVIGAGCQVSVGQKRMEAGVHRVRFSGLASTAPVKVLFSTDPASALSYVSVNGLQLKPRVHDYVGAVFELANVELDVVLQARAVVHFSIAQVVGIAEYDLECDAFRVV